MRLVINRCYGGFSLSREAVREYGKLLGFPVFCYRMKFSGGGMSYERAEDATGRHDFLSFSQNDLGESFSTDDVKAQWISDRDIPRDDANLVAVVEKLGEAADGPCARLEIIEIPDGLEWVIDEYDGMESVHEAHRSWA